MSYLSLFTHISPEAIENCAPYVADDIHFQDPFNDLRGRAAFQALLRKTLDDVDNPQFAIVDEAKGKTGIHYVRWTFSGRVKGLGLWQVTGMSELHYDAEGRVCLHIDHWDASQQFYARLPIVGWMIRKIRRKLQITG